MTTLNILSRNRVTVFYATAIFVVLLSSVADAQVGGGSLGGFTVGNTSFLTICQAIGNMVFSTAGLTLLAAGFAVAFLWAAWEHHLRGVGYSAVGVIGFLSVIWVINTLNSGGGLGGVGGL